MLLLHFRRVLTRGYCYIEVALLLVSEPLRMATECRHVTAPTVFTC